MRGFRLFERPVGAFTTIPPLQVVGSLASYRAGEPYEGRLDIVGAVGRCHVEIVEEDSYLPPGSYAYVDNFNQQVVLKWPAYRPPAPTDDEIINPSFEEGLEGWVDLRGNSWGVEVYDDSPESGHPPNNNPPTQLGNKAAYMRGAGRGDHILESIQYPVEPGQYITARSLWDQGPSNKDNNNLWTALGLYRDGQFIEEVRGDRIHDRTNRQRHWSEVDHLIQPGIDAVTIRLIAHRRNGRNRVIIVDNVETTGLRYEVGNEGEDELYFVKFKVTDSANRVAYWSGVIEVVVILWKRESNNSVYISRSVTDWSSEDIVSSDVAVPSSKHKLCHGAFRLSLSRTGGANCIWTPDDWETSVETSHGNASGGSYSPGGVSDSGTVIQGMDSANRYIRLVPPYTGSDVQVIPMTNPMGAAWDHETGNWYILRGTGAPNLRGVSISTDDGVTFGPLITLGQALTSGGIVVTNTGRVVVVGQVSGGSFARYTDDKFASYHLPSQDLTGRNGTVDAVLCDRSNNRLYALFRTARFYSDDDGDSWNLIPSLGAPPDGPVSWACQGGYLAGSGSDNILRVWDGTSWSSVSTTTSARSVFAMGTS